MTSLDRAALLHAAAETVRTDTRSAKRAIVVNAASIVGTYGITSAFGAVFWWLAAQRFAPASVGVASAVVSAMMLLSGLASLGLNTLLMGELRRRSDRARLLGSAVTIAGATGGALALAYALSIPFAVRDLRPLVADPISVSVFVIGTVAMAAGNTLDGAFMGLLKSQLRLFRNILLGLSKLLILIVLALAFAWHTSLTLTAAWSLGAVIALVAPAIAARSRLSLRDLRPDWALMKGLRRVVGEHQVLNLGLNVPSLVMPTLVIALLSARTNASFYVGWMIASVVFIVPPALTQMLFAVNEDDMDALAGQARMTTVLCAGIGLAAIVVVAVAARPILSVFGDSYARDATWPLRVFVVGVLPLTLKDHYVAVMRIGRQLRRAVPLIWAGTATELILASFGAATHGLLGLSVGWLAAVTLEAAVMGPRVLRVLTYGKRP